MFKQTNNSIIQKVLDFVKYHNAFTISLAIALVVGGAVLANEDIRNAVIGEAVVEQQGIDNTALLAADLDAFDMGVTITGVSEDDKNYYVDYSYRMFIIVGNVWQETTTTETLTVSKAALQAGDLGLYVAEELGEVVDSRLAYLREVQQNEQEKGLTLVKETTIYTGLIGLVLNPQTRELPGYQPVVEPLAMAEPFIAVEGIDEAGERARAAEQASQQATVPSVIPSEPPQAASEESPGASERVPDTIIDSLPDVLTTSTDAVFVFHCETDGEQFSVSDGELFSAATCSFQCKINELDWQPCQSPKEYVNLNNGQYTFKVFAIDEKGKYDSTPAEFTWTINIQATEPPVESPVVPKPPAEPPTPPATTTDESSTSTDVTTEEPSTTTDSVASSTDQVSTSTDETATSTQAQ